jgi:hypothetical protein
MSSPEVYAAQRALRAYEDMSAIFADVDFQPVAAATLSDLQDRAAAGIAGLGLVTGMVAGLPPADRREGSSLDTISLSQSADLARVKGTAVWGPGIERNQVSRVLQSPYYIVGHRAIDSGRPQPAELLLAPANSSGNDPRGLLLVKTWMDEVAAADAVMMQLLLQPLDPVEIEEHFNKQSRKLQVPASGNPYWHQLPLRLRLARRYSRRTAGNAEQRLRTDATSIRNTPAIMAAGYSIAFTQGLSYEERLSFDVLPRLIHLAMVYKKQELLRRLLDTLPSEGTQSALTSFIIDGHTKTTPGFS